MEEWEASWNQAFLPFLNQSIILVLLVFSECYSKHRLLGSHNRNLSPPSTGARGPRSRSAGLASGEASLLGLQMATWTLTTFLQALSLNTVTWDLLG